MPVDLNQLLEPRLSALLMMECQQGVIGGEGRFNALGEAVARHRTVEHIGRLLAAARRAAVPGFHLTTSRRPDSGGSTLNQVDSFDGQTTGQAAGSTFGNWAETAGTDGKLPWMVWSGTTATGSSCPF